MGGGVARETERQIGIEIEGERGVEGERRGGVGEGGTRNDWVLLRIENSIFQAFR